MNGKESLLKKSFNPRDVERMRNIVTKKYGEKTRVQAGYSKREELHKEGDLWEENNKTWTIKDGIKQNITKMDEFKHLVVLPLTCPTCKKTVKIHDLNRKMFAIHRMCFECVVDMENKLKVQGTYQNYEKKMLNENKDALIDDLERALEDWMTIQDTIITEQGDIENWNISTDKGRLYEETKETLKTIKDKEL